MKMHQKSITIHQKSIQNPSKSIQNRPLERGPGKTKKTATQRGKNKKKQTKDASGPKPDKNANEIDDQNSARDRRNGNLKITIKVMKNQLKSTEKTSQNHKIVPFRSKSVQKTIVEPRS